MAKMSITTSFYAIFLVSIICASLANALSLDISDLRTNGNYTTNEICYIRYYGVSIYDDYGNKAYGIKLKPEDRASPLMCQNAFTRPLEDYSFFVHMLQVCENHNYNGTLDYCEELENAIERKAKMYRDYIESGGDLSDLMCCNTKDTEDGGYASGNKGSQTTVLERLQSKMRLIYRLLEREVSL